MTNRSLKTLLAWVIIITQVGLLCQVFRYAIIDKLEASERDAALASLIPQLSSYVAAVILFLLKDSKSLSTKWATQKASINSIVITFILPLLTVSGSIVVVERAALGQMSPDDFVHYFTYLQAAQAVISTTIYAHFFRTEIAEAQKAATP